MHPLTQSCWRACRSGPCSRVRRRIIDTALSDRVVAGRAGRKWLPEAAEMLDAGDTEPPETVAALLVDIASGKLDELSGCLVDTTDDVDALAAQAAEIKKRALLRLRLEKPVA